MKHDHEAKIEKRADRGWIRHPGFITKSFPDEDGVMQLTTVYYWIDRHERTQIYTPRQKEITEILMQLYQDLNALCQLHEVAVNNPDSPAKNLFQSYSAMKITEVNPETGKPWTPIAHILRTMGKVPEVTFAEFTKFLLSESSNPTDFFVAMEKELDSKPDDD